MRRNGRAIGSTPTPDSTLRSSSVDWSRCRPVVAQYVAGTAVCAPRDTRTTGVAAAISLLATPACGLSSFTRLRAAGAEWRDATRDAWRESAATRRAERRRASNVATRFLTPFGGHVRAPLVHTYERRRRGGRRRRRYRRLLARVHGQREAAGAHQGA